MKYAVINLKTEPELKKKATAVAEKLGISISAVLNNELRRLATEKYVTFDLPEEPNSNTKKIMSQSKKEIEAGDYHTFSNTEDALTFLKKSMTY